MPHPTDRIAHTTAFVTPVMVHWLERAYEKKKIPDSFILTGEVNKVENKPKPSRLFWGFLTGFFSIKNSSNFKVSDTNSLSAEYNRL